MGNFRSGDTVLKMQEELSYYKIVSIPAIKDHIRSVGISTLLGSARCENFIAFFTDLKVPFVFNADTDHCYDFDTKNISKSPISSIDISLDKKTIVTGHEDGSITIWSIQNMSAVRIFNTKHTSKINYIKFGYISSEIYAGDVDGVVSRITVRSIAGFFSTSETIFATGEGEVTNIITMREQIPFNIVFLSWPNSYSIYDGENLELVASSEKYDVEISIDHFFDNEKIVLTISAGNNCTILVFKQLRIFSEICSHTFDSGNIIISEFLRSGLFISMTDGGELIIISFDGKIAVRTQASDLYMASTKCSFIQPFDDKMILVQPEGCLIVEFLDWKGKIKELQNNKNWSEAFRLFVEIDAGLAKDLVGLPQNLTQCRIELRKVASQTIRDYVLDNIEADDEVLSEVLATAIATIATLGLTGILEGLVEDFRKGKKATIFYEAVLRSRVRGIAQLLTPQFIKQYLDDSQDIAHAEAELLHVPLETTHAVPIFAIAVELKMIDLQKKILLEYLDDVITPCALMFEHKRLAEYVSESFDDRKPIELQRAVAAWLLFKQSRLEELFREDFNKAPENALKIINLCPIPVAENRSIQDIQAFDAIIRTIDIFDYDDVSPILSSLLPLYVKIPNLVPSKVCLQKIMMHIFISNDPSPIREHTLEKILETFPNLVSTKALKSVCKANGFVKIATKRFLSEKDYFVIIGSYIHSSEYSQNVFDFISSHLEDKLEITSAFNNNLSGLLGIDPIRTARTTWIILHTQKPKDDEEQRESDIKAVKRILQQLPKQNRFIYLRALDEVIGEKAMDQELNHTLIQLTCEFDPINAVHVLRQKINNDPGKPGEEPWIDFPTVLEICQAAGRIDCVIQIHLALDNNDKAVDLIGEELENALCDLVTGGIVNKLSSLDDLNDDISVSRQMQMVNIALSLLTDLYKNSNKNNIDQWQEIIKRFQFPLFYATKKGDEKTQKAMTLIFSFFLVKCLGVIGADIAFKMLHIFFCGLPSVMYRSVLSYIFGQLHYLRSFYSVVEDILVDDCIKVIDRAYDVQNHGLHVENPICAICHEQLGRGVHQFKVFACGHCVHVNKCGGEQRTSCPVCNGVSTDAETPSVQQKSVAALRRCVDRFERAMRRNYDDNAPCEAASEKPFFGRYDECVFNILPVDVVPFYIPESCQFQPALIPKKNKDNEV